MKKTKVTILGQEWVNPELKKIEFVNYVSNNFNISSAITLPKEWDNILLLERDYYEGMDLMFATMNHPTSGALLIGHFNDGIV